MGRIGTLEFRSPLVGTTCCRCPGIFAPGDMVELVTYMGASPVVAHLMCPRSDRRTSESWPAGYPNPNLSRADHRREEQR